MIRKITIFLISGLILAGGVKVFFVISSHKKKLPQEKVVPQRKQVRLIHVKKKDLSAEITGFGTSRSKREIPLTSELDGKISRLGKNFETGRVIRKGELLFEVDSESIKIKLSRIKAEIEKINVTTSRLMQEEKNLKERLKINRENLELSKKEYLKNKKLFKKGIISETIKNNSEKNYLSQEEQRINLTNQLALIPMKLSEEESSVKIKQTELAQEELKVKKSLVRAPFTGVIEEKNVESSQFIRAGNSLGTLLDISTIEVPVELSTDHFTFFNFTNLSKSGRKLPASVYWKQHRWDGIVSHFEKFEEKTRSVKVVVEIRQKLPGKNGLNEVMLTKGMFCEVRLRGKKYKDVIALPNTAIQTNREVYISENNRLKIRRVEIQEYFDNIVIIKSGLKGGEKVIVSRIKNPVIGMALVEIKEDEPK